MGRKRWIAATLVVIAALAALAGAWFAYRYGARYCMAMKAANLARDAKDKIAPLDCAEFWFNRYQSAWSSIVSAGVALFAAILAWRSVRRQISLQEDDHIRQEIRAIEAEIRERENYVAQLDRALKTAGDVAGAVHAFGRSDEPFIEALTHLDNRSVQVRPFYLNELLPNLDREIYRLPLVARGIRQAGANRSEVDAELGNILNKIITSIGPLNLERDRTQSAISLLIGRQTGLREKRARIGS